MSWCLTWPTIQECIKRSIKRTHDRKITWHLVRGGVILFLAPNKKCTSKALKQAQDGWERAGVRGGHGIVGHVACNPGEGSLANN
jgi:hypothetical protein